MTWDDEIDGAKVDEAQAKIIAASTAMTSGAIDEADHILDELKESPDVSIDTFFGFLLGLVAFLAERLDIDEDHVIQVIALRMHLSGEGVLAENLPGLAEGALPSEEAEEALRVGHTALERIEKVCSAALKNSASLPQDESDVLRGEALTAVGKLAHSAKEKVE